MKLHNIVLLFFFVILIVGGATYFITDYMEPKETIITEFDFTPVESGIGFNLDPDKMHFSTVCKGCSAKRWIIINNTYPHRSRVEFYVGIIGGNNVDVIIDPPTGFILSPHTSQKFTVILKVPKNYSSSDLHEGVFVTKIFKAYPWDKYEPLQESQPIRPLCFRKNLRSIGACRKLVLEYNVVPN